MALIVLLKPKAVELPKWVYGYVNLLRDHSTGKRVLAFRCPGAQETDQRGVIFFDGDYVTHGSSKTVEEYYTFERSMLWSEVKVEVSK